MPYDQAIDLAKDTPTSSDPTNPGPCVTATAPRSVHVSAACSSARSTTPQMPRRCRREASSGTTAPHSRWIAYCDATTFDLSSHGLAASPVSATTAAAVSSHDVSIARRFMAEAARADGFPQRHEGTKTRKKQYRFLFFVPLCLGVLVLTPWARAFVSGTRELAERLFDRLRIRRPKNAPLRGNPGELAVRRHVERRIPRLRPLRRQPGRPEAGHLALVALLDWDLAT